MYIELHLTSYKFKIKDKDVQRMSCEFKKVEYDMLL